MEAFHKMPGLRDSSDAAEIARMLHAEFDRTVADHYGTSLTIPVLMQVEVIRNCLTKAAEIHAAESGKGWRFKEVEIAFPTLITIRGTEIRGRIDLIQYHEDLGYRILDYKTSSTAVKPADAHLKSVKSAAARETILGGPCGAFAHVEHGGKFHVWQNLQLPLYARIMADHYEDTHKSHPVVKTVGVGYINLPRALSEAGLEMWDDIDERILQSAWTCAEGVVSNIQQGIFWPPGPKGKYDDFESLVFQDMASSFDPTALKRVQAMIASGSFHPQLSSP
jgi:ATP-dependent helicase/nuclease subunit B